MSKRGSKHQSSKSTQLFNLNHFIEPTRVYFNLCSKWYHNLTLREINNINPYTQQQHNTTTFIHVHLLNFMLYESVTTT